MYCPKCKAEYVEGIRTCADCGCHLVEKLEDCEEGEFREFVSVATTSNRFAVPLAKSILESAGIDYFVNGEMMSGYIGIIVPVDIEVPLKDAETAKELLKDLEL